MFLINTHYRDGDWSPTHTLRFLCSHQLSLEVHGSVTALSVGGGETVTYGNWSNFYSSPSLVWSPSESGCQTIVIVLEVFGGVASQRTGI